MKKLKYDAELMAKNPVIAANIYDKIMKTSIEILVGISITRLNKKSVMKQLRGIFGHVYAIYGVIIWLIRCCVYSPYKYKKIDAIVRVLRLNVQTVIHEKLIIVSYG